MYLKEVPKYLITVKRILCKVNRTLNSFRFVFRIVGIYSSIMSLHAINNSWKQACLQTLLRWSDSNVANALIRYGGKSTSIIFRWSNVRKEPFHPMLFTIHLVPSLPVPCLTFLWAIWKDPATSTGFQFDFIVRCLTTLNTTWFPRPIDDTWYSGVL